MSDPNYYELLEIEPNATPEQVREAYRMLAMVWHPDRFPKDSKLWAHANERMQQINEAYNALKNVTENDSQLVAEPSDSTRHANESAQNQARTVADERARRAHEQEEQRIEARRRSEEQQQRIQEQQQREEEQKQREDEARIAIENEQRRVEAERLRVLMREGQRVEDLQRQRSEKGLCMLCGKPLSSLEKLKRRNRHRDCSVFIDDASAMGTRFNQTNPQVQETANDS